MGSENHCLSLNFDETLQILSSLYLHHFDNATHTWNAMVVDSISIRGNELFSFPRFGNKTKRGVPPLLIVTREVDGSIALRCTTLYLFF